MKKVLVLIAALVCVSALTWAAGPKTYQVTGPILEIRDDVIVVQKGSEKWELAKDASTLVEGKLAVGQKVTIEYAMRCTKISAKEAPKSANTGKDEKAAAAQAKPNANPAPTPAKKGTDTAPAKPATQQPATGK